MAQQYNNPNAQNIKKRYSVLAFLKGSTAPLVLYVKEPQALYEELLNLIQTQKSVIVEKETAIQQYMESMEVLRNATENIEYTFDCRNLSKKEEEQFGKMIECITRTYEKKYR